MHADHAAFEAAFDQVSALLKERVGHTLFTVSRVVPGGAPVERIYSSMPAHYPVGGTNMVDTTDRDPPDGPRRNFRRQRAGRIRPFADV